MIDITQAIEVLKEYCSQHEDCETDECKFFDGFGCRLRNTTPDRYIDEWVEDCFDDWSEEDE